jgi:L-seryl-tRNA(Ser) seleniumtransferase
LLYDTEPRIVLGGATGERRGAAQSSVTIMPYMMMPDDHKVVAERLRAVLASPPKVSTPAKTSGPLANVDGQWKLKLSYFCGSSDHHVVFEQKEDSLAGTHRGEVIAGDLRGSVNGPDVRFVSRHRYEGTVLEYDFLGKLEGDRLTGTVQMGEYGTAEWSAGRYSYRA